MTDIVLKNHFVDNGDTDRSGENFQNKLFRGIDFEERKEPVSFFRADFRGVKIEDMKFYHNNFDRADIINATVTRTSFKNCNWGTDFINTMFSFTEFTGNAMDTCTIHNCFYDSCNFVGERVVNTTNRDSTFKNCRFENCLFEMNSYNDIHFINCKFQQIDLSNMGAYDLTFDDCRFNKLTVDPDYFGTYLFKNTPIDDIAYAYRGNNFEMSGNLKDDLQSLAVFYLNNHRYYEAFNTTLLFRYFLKEEISIENYFQELLNQIISEENDLIRQDQLNRIVKMLIFYADSTVLSGDEIFFFIGYLREVKLKFNSLNDKLGYLNNIDLLANTVEAYVFGHHIKSSLLAFKPTYAEIHIEETDLEEFKHEFNSFFNAIMEQNELANLQGYRIVGTRKGSLIIEVIGYAVGLYVLATILKSSFSKFLEIKMEYQLFQKAQKLIDLEINSISELSKNAPIIRKIMHQPGDEIFKKAKPLSGLMKQFHIFPNALSERTKIG